MGGAMRCARGQGAGEELRTRFGRRGKRRQLRSKTDMLSAAHDGCPACAVKIIVSAAAVTHMLRRGSPAPLNAFAAVVRQDVDGIALMADLRALYVKNFLRNGAAYCVRPGYVRTYVPFNGRRHCARRNLK